MYAEVLIQYPIKSLDHTFTYHIPQELVGDLTVGMKVVVPFGKKEINGFIVNISNNFFFSICHNYKFGSEQTSIIRFQLKL